MLHPSHLTFPILRLSSLYYIWGNSSTGRLSHLGKVTQLVNYRINPNSSPLCLFFLRKKCHIEKVNRRCIKDLNMNGKTTKLLEYLCNLRIRMEFLLPTKSKFDRFKYIKIKDACTIVKSTDD